MNTNEIKNLFTDMTAEESATVNGGHYYYGGYGYKKPYYSYSYYKKPYYGGYGYKKASYYGGYGYGYGYGCY